MEASLLVAPKPASVPPIFFFSAIRGRSRRLLVAAASHGKEDSDDRLSDRNGRDKFFLSRSSTRASSSVMSAAASCCLLLQPSTAAAAALELGGDLQLDPSTVAGVAGPALSALGFLFILRIVMSWYPRLPVTKFPYVVAYAPTEPFLAVTRKLIPPLGGVDVTPVVWFGLVSFLNEILVGPQGLLVLLSQQQQY